MGFFLIIRLPNYDKSPDHVESASKITLSIMLPKEHTLENTE
jgi:hypothetical protein